MRLNPEEEKITIVIPLRVQLWTLALAGAIAVAGIVFDVWLRNV